MLFLDKAVEMSQFLAMDPEVKFDVLPRFVRSGRIRQQVGRAAPGPVFWGMLTVEKLEATGMSVSAFASHVEEIIIDKIVTQQENEATCQKNLVALFADGCYEGVHVSESVMRQLECLACVVGLASADLGSIESKWKLDFINDSVTLVADKANVVAHSLVMYSPGQKLFQKSKVQRDALQASDRKVSKFTALAEALPTETAISELCGLAGGLQELVLKVNEAFALFDDGDLSRTSPAL